MRRLLIMSASVLCAALMLLPLTGCSDNPEESGNDDGGEVYIACERHTVTDWEITAETHSGRCTTCGEYFTEPHYYHEGSTVCEECGYDSANGLLPDD